MDHLISQLDSERFGIKVARIETWDPEIEKTLEQLIQKKVSLVITKVESSNIPLINHLESVGFRMKDAQLTYFLDFKKSNLQKSRKQSPEISIRDANEKDADTISEISKHAFQDQGHYFANSRLARNSCAEVYADWARRACIDETYANKNYVALINNKIVGFINFKILNENGKKHALCGLGAVAEPHRKKGIYQSLIQTSIEWGNSIGLDGQTHNILLTNSIANYILSSYGFILTQSRIVMHCWLEI